MDISAGVDDWPVKSQYSYVFISAEFHLEQYLSYLLSRRLYIFTSDNLKTDVMESYMIKRL